MRQQDFEDVDALLSRWGRYVEHSIHREMGWGRETTEARLMRDGGLIPSEGSRPEVIIRDLDVVENAVRQMSKFYQEVVKQRYIYGGPDLLRAERMKMSRAHYLNCLKVAQGMVIGYLKAAA